MGKIIVVSMSVCLFFASFFWPAYVVDRANGVADPIAIFLTGWMGVFTGSFACIAWLANPLFVIALILFVRNRSAAIFVCLLAFVVAASFLLFHTIIDDEAGHYATITEHKTGYWLWLGSIGMLLISMVIWFACSSRFRTR